MGSNELSDYVFERDRLEFSLGDTLDIKTGLLLASLTFLAIQSSDLMKSTLLLGQLVAQLLSIACLILGGLFCVIELWPRAYLREAPPDQYELWISNLEDYRKKYPNAIAVPDLPAARLSTAKERIQTNGAINQRKSKFMFLAFYCVIAAFLANVVTLLMRLF